MSVSFRTYSETLQLILESNGKELKIGRFADYLKSIPDDEQLKLAVRFLGEGAFEEITGKRVIIGSRTICLAAAKFCEINYELIFKPCRKAAGNSSEAIERLMHNLPAALKKRSPLELSLNEILQIFDHLSTTKTRAEKEKLLWDSWKKMTPVEIKFFLRIIEKGSLRIGLNSKALIRSIAKAFGRNEDDANFAHIMTGSFEKTALLAKQNRLSEARFQIFSPVPFMLASTVNQKKNTDYSGNYLQGENPEKYLIEEKFDGMRSQIHVKGKNVRIYSRSLEDITQSFPELVEFFQAKNLPATVFDGEICLFKNEMIMPCTMLQKRLSVKKASKKLAKDYPAIFISFDILFANGEITFGRPFSERRSTLKTIAEEFRLPIARQYSIKKFGELDSLFKNATDHGNSGLLLKHKESRYEYGRRNYSWLKIKKQGKCFDTVIMYAHSGGTKNGSPEFTLGISVKDDERYVEEYIPIGKTGSVYPAVDLKKIETKIKELTIEKYGPTLGLLPQLIAEVEFDHLYVNNRTKAGYKLRLPKISNIRWDKDPVDVITLKELEENYQQNLAEKRSGRNKNLSIIF